jgi:hypothetical protein
MSPHICHVNLESADSETYAKPLECRLHHSQGAYDCAEPLVVRKKLESPD